MFNFRRSTTSPRPNNNTHEHQPLSSSNDHDHHDSLFDQDDALDAAFSDPLPDARELPNSVHVSRAGSYIADSPLSSPPAFTAGSGAGGVDDPLRRYQAQGTGQAHASQAESSARAASRQGSTINGGYDFEGDPFASRAGAGAGAGGIGGGGAGGRGNSGYGDAPPGYEGNGLMLGGGPGDSHDHDHDHDHFHDSHPRPPTLRERLFPSFYSRIAAEDPDSTARGAGAGAGGNESAAGGWLSGRTGGLLGVLSGNRMRSSGGGQGGGNDGVFANLQAVKPGRGRNGMPGDWDGEDDNKDEPLPSYEAAAADSTPPYWETTVVAPIGYLGPDDILVDGLPVGNLFAFAWNLLVSMSFQFVGFLLTYLLHTSHAAKNGSRAGLGITLIQYGLYLRNAPRDSSSSSSPLFGPVGGNTTMDSDSGEDTNWFWPPEEQSPTDLGQAPSLEGDAGNGGVNGTATGMVPDMGLGDAERDQASEWMAWIIIAAGWFLVLGGYINYWRAIRWAKAVREGGSAGASGREESGVPPPAGPPVIVATV